MEGVELEIPVVSTTFEPASSGTSMAQIAADMLQGERHLGIETIKRALVEDSQVTVVGRLVFPSNTSASASALSESASLLPSPHLTPLITRPTSENLPFIVSTRTLPELLKSRVSAVRLWMWVTVAFALVGAGMLGRRGVSMVQRWMLRRRREIEERRRRIEEERKADERRNRRKRKELKRVAVVEETDASLSGSWSVLESRTRRLGDGGVEEEKGLDLTEEDDDDGLEEINDSERCVVCLERRRGVLLLDCKHLVLCHSCSEAVTHCPICRTRISQRITVYT
ncbi:hypothetical protein HDU67_007250 [Dinochytrium kinnereticum]|nr:hypothetical protein HDU67_007250 [Dinochytrium kinnereticum]